MNLVILHLYPEHMNLYGDRGNVLTLMRRAQWRGIEVEVKTLGPGQAVDWGDVDLLFMGGGEDVHQAQIAPDFLHRLPDLKAVLSDGVPMLAICGAYQLLGHYYQTQDGQKLPGLGVLDVTTEPGSPRAIGDVVSEMVLPIAPSTLVGFENHGGRTRLGSLAKPLAHVRKGQGNNGQDGTEGAVWNHVVGTYLHGSLLPKNPHLADLLLTWAWERKGGQALEPLDDAVEWMAHRVILRRDRRESVSSSR